MYVCTQRGDVKLPLKYVDVRDAKRVFIEIEYEMPKLFSEKSAFILLSSMISSENRSETRTETGPSAKRVLSVREVKNRTKTTVHFDVKDNGSILNLTLVASRACVQVFKITMYFYVCPKNKTLKVSRTPAPNVGFEEARVNCSIKQTGKGGSVVVAKCGSNGEWVKLEDKGGGCTDECDAGTELIVDACTGA